MDIRMLPAALGGLLLGLFFMVGLAVTDGVAWLLGTGHHPG